MAESIKKSFDTNGSALAVPISPANGFTPDSVSIVGNSLLHYQYSNIGDPTLNMPAYTNFGAAAMGYSNPAPSQFGKALEAYQEPVNRYSTLAPEERSF